MTTKPLDLYKKYHADRDDERLGLFQALVEQFEIRSALYPGSYVHVTPSFVFPRVVYADMMPEAKDFYASEEVRRFVERRKLYPEQPEFSFHLGDYRQGLDMPKNSVDLLISQYAGFVSQACKGYLKPGGLLVANNSHGDAGMANLDDEFKLVAVYNRRGDKFSLSDKDLDGYFIPKQDMEITRQYLEELGRGVGYTKSAAGYLFEKVV